VFTVIVAAVTETLDTVAAVPEVGKMNPPLPDVPGWKPLTAVKTVAVAVVLAWTPQQFAIDRAVVAPSPVASKYIPRWLRVMLLYVMAT
jgi:hypothetical protein